MKANEEIKTLREQSVDTLKKKKIDLLKEKFSLRMQTGTDQCRQNHMFKNIRRTISRINTILSENQCQVSIDE